MSSGTPSLTPPRRPPGIQSEWWSTNPGRALARAGRAPEWEKEAEQRARRVPGTPCPPLTPTVGFAQGTSKGNTSLKKKILIWSFSASSQARVKGEGEHGAPRKPQHPGYEAGTHRPKLGLCSWRGCTPPHLEAPLLMLPTGQGAERACG